MGRKCKNIKSRFNNLKKGGNICSISKKCKLETDSDKKMYSNPLYVHMSGIEQCNNRSVIQGNFHQSYFQRYQISSGKQCVANSFMAIIYSMVSNIEQWTANTLDFILDKGNELYCEIRNGQSIQQEYLLLNELPTYINIFNNQFEIELNNNSLVGLLGLHNHLQDDNIMTLSEAIQASLQHYNSCFITFGCNTFCTMKKNGIFYIFDSHSRSKTGMLVPHGTSVLLKKNDIMEVYNHCINLAQSLNLSTISQFEVTGINVKIALYLPLEPDNVKNDTGNDNDVIVCNEELNSFEFKPLPTENVYTLCSFIGIPKPCYKKSNIICKPLNNPSNIKRILGDGNCFFRCLSYCITQSEDYHRKIRLSVVKHMKNNPEIFTPLLRPDYKSLEEYLKHSKMRLLGTWATELEIQAACDLLQIDIYTFSNKQWLKFSKLQNAAVKPVDSGIYIEHENQNHYNVVVDVFDKNVNMDLNCDTDSINSDNNQTDISMHIKKNFNRKRGKNWTRLKKKNQFSEEKYNRYRYTKHDKYWQSVKISPERIKYNNIYESKLRKKQYQTRGHYTQQQKELYKQKYQTILKNELQEKYSDKLKDVLKKKYSDKLKDVLKEKYSHKLKNVLKQKYFKQLRPKLKQKYVNVLRMQHRTKSLLEQYKMKRNEVSKKNYRTKSKYRQKLIQKSKHKYNTCKIFKCKIKEQVKERRNIKSKVLTLIGNVIEKFRADCACGPVYVCCVCEKLLFRNQVTKCKKDEFLKKTTQVKIVAQKCIQENYLHKCNSECEDGCTVSDNMKSLWICFTCYRKISKGKLPAEAIVNNLSPGPIPPQLNSLNTIEKHLIALHIPFIRLVKVSPHHELKVSGPCTCVPNNISEITNVLPRNPNDDKLIRIKLKRKLNYKSYHDYQTVTKRDINDALEYLISNNKHYENVNINDNWMNEVQSNENSEMEHSSCEIDHTDLPNMSDLNTLENEEDELPDIDPNISNNVSDIRDTCLQPVDIAQHVLDNNFDEIISTCISPAEQNKPVRLLTDLTNEAKSFPSLFPTGKGTFSDDREEKITLGRYLHCKLMNVDKRFAQSSDWLFYAQYIFELNQIISGVSIALRQGKHGVSKISPDMLTQKDALKDIFKSDQGYKFMKCIRGTPSYWQTAQKDLIAMVRQLGKPTWFASFSCGELRFEEILDTILKQQGDNRNVHELNWIQKRELLRSNPVTVVRMFDHRFQLFLKNVIMSPAQPIGKVIDYFWRYEVQQRGTLHTHCLFWVEDAPIVGVNTDHEVINFVDKYVSCELPNPDIDSELHEIITSVQTHSSKHSKSCKKGRKACRFNFPRPPSERTFISRTVENEDDQNNTTFMSLTNAKSILENIYQCISNPNKNYEKLEDLYKELDVNQRIFELASDKVTKKSNLVLKRNVNDIWINQYNKDLLRAWNSNLDIQYVFDSFACVIYILSYISKSEKEMGMLLNQVHQEAKKGSLDAKASMKKISSTYLNSREVSSHEAVLRVTHLPMKQFSRKVVFIPTGEGNIRLTLPLKVLQNKAKQGILNDSNMFMTNIVDIYKARPLGQEFDALCLAKFCSEYRLMAKSENPNTESEKNPAYELQNDLGFIIKRSRTKPAVVRYARFSPTLNRENYYLSKLQLFLPYRIGNQLKPNNFEYYEDFFNTGVIKLCSKFELVKNIVERNRKLFEKDDFDVNNFEEVLDSALNLEDAWASICPETELDRITTEDIQNDLNKECEDVDVNTNIPDLIESTANNARSRREACITSISRSEALPLLRSLNEKQSQIFYEVRQYCVDKVHDKNPEQILLFVTGGAGSGKSHLIKSIYYEASRILSQKQQNLDDITVLLCAPTGVSAFNINCSTIHSTFNININSKFPPYQPLGQESMNTLRVKYSNVQLVIIDEISMVNMKLLCYISGRLNQIKGCDQLFGNVSVICFGDFYQLSPVRSQSLYNDNGLIDIWNGFFKIVHLTEIMRQKDLEFAELLNRIRVHKKGENMNEEDIRMLKGRETGEEVDFLHIFSTNLQVQQHNDKMLKKKCPDYISIEARDYIKDSRTGKMTEKDKPLKNIDSPLSSLLSVGVNARVMLIVNLNISAGLTNGTFGTITYIENDADNKPKIIYVLFDDKRVGVGLEKSRLPQDIPKNSIPIELYEDNVNYKCIRRQFPLRLSYATTVHKVQGLSLDKAVVSLHKIFQAGQAYVALSRLRTINGLIIQDFNEKAVYCDQTVEKALDNMEPFLNPAPPCTSEGIVLILHNIQGLVSHYEDIKNDRRFLQADYICLTETWINRQGETSYYKLPNFSYHNASRLDSYDSEILKDLSEKGHGGVGVYYKTCCNVLNLGKRNLEYLAFNIPDIHYIVIVIYRPPQYTLSIFLKYMQDLLIELSQTDYGYVIMGDFNQNLFAGNTSIEQLFKHFGFSQCVKCSTTESGTLIDHVYINNRIPKQSIDIQILPTYFSYHEGIQLTII